ncbi:Crp/Fnr family transcriptional regulator [Leptolyngbya sp. AN02str]|uniref:Crp/Fnr family transcriptional regulator n=1 Tax=Leptolyngbya sp. AN02str TaxID=3423363 RepID=UPI003D323C5E
MSALKSSNFWAYLTAVTTCLINSQQPAEYRVIQATPEIALQMMAVFNQRLQQLHDMVHGLVSERAVVRLARFLQYAAGESGTCLVGQEACLRLPLSHYEIARSIGITYEECVRLFKQLHWVVSYSRGGKITILDWNTLDAIAQGTLNPGDRS